MKTQELIVLLATDAVPVESNAAARRFGIALGGGTAGGMFMMLVQLGVRADIANAALLPMFWIKLAFVACIAASGLIAAARLSRPGGRIFQAPSVLAAPMLFVWGVAAWTLAELGAPAINWRCSMIRSRGLRRISPSSFWITPGQ